VVQRAETGTQTHRLALLVRPNYCYIKTDTTCIRPAKGNASASVRCDILSYRKCRWNPAAGPLTSQILASAFLTKFFSDLMKYGADVLENQNNIPRVAEAHLPGISEKL